jgi:hypothetical protein
MIRSRTATQQVSSSDVRGVLIFGYPEPPPVLDADTFYQAAEFDAMLFGICAIVDDRRAVRWAYLVSGYSDVPLTRTEAEEHPLLPRGLAREMDESGTVEVVLAGDRAYGRTTRGVVREWLLKGGEAVPIELTLAVAENRYVPYIGVLPIWSTECPQLLDQITRPKETSRAMITYRRRRPDRDRPAGTGLLLVAHRGDSTAVHLAHRARAAGVPAKLCDLTQLYSADCDNTQAANLIEEVAPAPYVFARPLLLTRDAASSAVAPERHFRILRELQARRLPTLNRPIAGYTNISKVAHLTALARAGLQVPPSLATNDGAAVESFCREWGHTVYKSASWNRSVASRMTYADFDRLHLLEYCPTLVQHYIGGHNVRVHLVFGAPIAVRIASPETDYRFGVEATYDMVELESELTDKLNEVALSNDLAISGTDLKWDPVRARWNVLEMNRMPGFDYYDHRSGGSVADRIAAGCK